MASVFTIQTFDPYLDMPDMVAEHKATADLNAYMVSQFEYWHGMVRCVRRVADTDAYAKANNYPVHQTDIFHVIRDHENKKA